MRNARGEKPRRHGRRGDGLNLDEKSLILIVGQLQKAIQRCPVKGVPGWIDGCPLRRIFLPPDIGVLADRMPAFPVPYAIGLTLQAKLGAQRSELGQRQSAKEERGDSHAGYLSSISES